MNVNITHYSNLKAQIGPVCKQPRVADTPQLIKLAFLTPGSGGKGRERHSKELQLDEEHVATVCFVQRRFAFRVGHISHISVLFDVARWPGTPFLPSFTMEVGLIETVYM